MGSSKLDDVILAVFFCFSLQHSMKLAMEMAMD